MNLRRITGMAGLALLLPAVSFAQEQGPPAGGMRGGPGMDRMQQTTIDWLLTQKEQFRPTGEQVAKLQEISKKLSEATAKQREEMRKLRDQAMSGSGDRREMFEKMRPLRDEMRKQDQQATKEALEQLNTEQKKVVEELLEARRKEMENRRGMMGGRPGR